MKSSSILLLSLILFLLFFRLGSYGLIETSDARYSEISLEMADSGDYITPRLNGIKHFDKPPLTYWLAATGIRLLGKNEWGTRIFQAVAALIILIMVFLFTKTFFNRKDAIYSVLFLAATPIFFGSSHVLTTDLLNSLATTGALFSFFLWYKNQKFFYLAAFYVIIGISFLIKGPIGLFVVLPIIILFLLSEHNLRALSKMKLWMFLLSFAVAAPWYIALIKQNPGLLSYLIDKQLLSRLHKGGLGHPRPMLYYLWIFPSMMFPAVIPAFFQKKINQIKRFLLIGALWSPLFFSIPATKLPLYILPSAPFVAILAATSDINFKKYTGYVTPVIFILFLSAAVLIHFGISKKIIYQDQISLLLGSAALLITAFYFTKQFRLIAASYTLIPFVLTILFLKPAITGNLKIYKPFMNHIRKSDTIVEYHAFVRAIPFYLAHPVKTVGLKQDLNFDSRKTINRLVVTENDFWKLWQDKSLKVILNRDNLSRFKRYKILDSKKKLVLISNLRH